MRLSPDKQRSPIDHCAFGAGRSISPPFKSGLYVCLLSLNVYELCDETVARRLRDSCWRHRICTFPPLSTVF